MAKSVLLITIMIVGLEARSTLHLNPVETNIQGLNRNQENETINDLENTSNQQTYVDAVSGAIIPDRKPLDEGKLGTIAPVTVEAVLEGKEPNEGVSASKRIRGQVVSHTAYKSSRIESNKDNVSPNPNEESTSSIAVVAHKSSRTELSPDVSAIALKSIREQGSAIKSPRIESNDGILSPDPSEDLASSSLVVAQKSIRTEPPVQVSAMKSPRNEVNKDTVSPNPNEESTSNIAVVAHKSSRTELSPDVSAIALKSIREQGSAIKSPRIESNDGTLVVAQKSIRTEPPAHVSAIALKNTREQGSAVKSSQVTSESNIFVVSASKDIRVEEASNPSDIFASKGIREQRTGLKATRIEPKTEIKSEDEHEFNLPPYGPFYCTAFCVASCVEKKFGSLKDCNTSCETFNDIVQCTDDDVDCWRSCGGLLSGSSSVQLTAPNIFYNGYVQDPTFDPLTISINWDFVSESSTYVVEFIPTPESAAAGAVSLQEIVDHPWYIFTKADICHEYYARVAAVNSNGLGKLSSPVLSKAATLQISEEVTFTVLDTIIEDGLTGKVASVHISYSALSGFSPNDYAINGRVSASECKNPVSELFLKEDDDSTDGVYYPLVHIEKSLTNYEMVIILPEEIFSSDCLYSFKPSSFVTRCGLSTDDGLAQGGIGLEFRIDANDAQSKTFPSITKEEITPVCQMTGLDLTVLNKNNNGIMDVVVSWDALSDNIHKTYLVHHWSNSVAQIKNNKAETVLYDTGYSKIVFYLSLNSDDLHEFQICAVSTTPEGVFDTENILWETVPSYKTELKMNSMPFLTKLDEKKITCLILVSLLGAVTFLLLASIVFSKRVKCGRTKNIGFTKMYTLPDDSSVEKKKLPMNSFSNPVV